VWFAFGGALSASLPIVLFCLGPMVVEPAKSTVRWSALSLPVSLPLWFLGAGRYGTPPSPCLSAHCRCHAPVGVLGLANMVPQISFELALLIVHIAMAIPALLPVHTSAIDGTFDNARSAHSTLAIFYAIFAGIHFAIHVWSTVLLLQVFPGKNLTEVASLVWTSVRFLAPSSPELTRCVQITASNVSTSVALDVLLCTLAASIWIKQRFGLKNVLHFVVGSVLFSPACVFGYAVAFLHSERAANVLRQETARSPGKSLQSPKGKSRSLEE
jgi:hypothetical protein